jgi:hypothetical protein
MGRLKIDVMQVKLAVPSGQDDCSSNHNFGMMSPSLVTEILTIDRKRLGSIPIVLIPEEGCPTLSKSCLLAVAHDHLPDRSNEVVALKTTKPDRGLLGCTCPHFWKAARISTVS